MIRPPTTRKKIRVGVLDIEDQDLIAKAQEIIGEKN